MKRTAIVLCFILAGCTTAQINQTIGEVNKSLGTEKPLTTDEVASGLKEALIKGISNGSDIVSQVDGYFKNPEIKIPFPPEVKKVEDKLLQVQGYRFGNAEILGILGYGHLHLLTNPEKVVNGIAAGQDDGGVGSNVNFLLAELFGRNLLQADEGIKI